MKKIIFLILLIPFFLFATEKTPTQTVETALDEIVGIVNSAKESAITEKRHEILGIVERVFDFEEMAKRSLGTNWKACTAEQQKEFVSVFSDFLANTYIDRIDEVKPGMVDIESEKIIQDKALVRTKVKLKEETFPIDYKMLDRNDGAGWQVYDVVIENVGLISNYRNEFAGIMRKEKFEGLINRLKEKNQQESQDKV